MNAMKTMALVGAVIGGLVLWEAFKPEGGVGAVIEGVRSAPRNAGGAGGFASIPCPTGSPRRAW